MTEARTAKQRVQHRQRAVLLATDASRSVIGEVVDGKLNTIGYGVYGEQSAQQEVTASLGFNGQLRESTIGWYLLGNGYRVYNPRLMRFHSPDSLSPFGKGGLNSYIYCGGEPVMNSDPTGRYFEALTWGLARISSRLRTAASTATTFVTSTVSNTANAVIRSASSATEVLGSSKKALSKALFGAEPFPGPPPRRFIQTAPPNRVITRSNPYAGPNSVRGQQARLDRGVSGTASASRLSHPARSDTNSNLTQIRQSVMEHPMPSIRDTHSPLLNREGNPVALIRTGR